MSNQQFLVCNHKKEFLGPYQKERLIERIRLGEVSLGSRLCLGNVYDWFYLEDQKNLVKYLGEVPEPFFLVDDQENVEADDQTKLTLVMQASQKETSPHAQGFAKPFWFSRFGIILLLILGCFGVFLMNVV